MSERLPHHQHISGVSTQNHSQAFVGSARDVYFTSSKSPQGTLGICCLPTSTAKIYTTEASEQAAIACRNALFLTDPTVVRESLISTKGTRVAGTCEWIAHDVSYRAWLHGDSDGFTRLLWISGGPGKGKTMMSVFLTEELEENTSCTDGAGLLFFFCSAQDEKRNTGVAVLRSLVHQIVTMRPQLVRHALPYFEKEEQTQQTLSSLETLWIIFTKLLADAELGRMFCVLDGLDECEESTLRVLVPRLMGLHARGAPSPTYGEFKLAIISRDMPGLQGCTRIRLDPDNDEKVVCDIELFVSARVDELSRIEGFNDDFRSSLQTALLARAEGTFLWVGFAMHELQQERTCTAILKALEDLPSGLPAIYSRMLLRIPAKQREMSHVILRWVAIAARPLQLQELATAVGLQITLPQLSVEQATRDAITHCGPLLKVQEQEVSLVHQSARDYLLRKERDGDAVLEVFRLSVEASHLELAQKCLDCIAQSGLQYKAINIDAELDPRESPLLRYATLHWPEHARSCSALAVKLFDRPAPFFQRESPLRTHWWDTYNEKVRIHYRRPQSLLHIACILEIVPWVEAVLAKKSWRPRYHKHVDKKYAEGETALHWAVQVGNKILVRLLVDQGANVKAKVNDGQTALHWAAQEGNEAVVQLLIDKGADVKAKVSYGHTVLYWAAREGNEAVVQLLIDRGADVKAKENNGRTALHTAASSWKASEAVVRLLIDGGADLEAKTNNGKTVLHTAASSWSASEAIVELLIDKGADVNTKDKYGDTVLHSSVLRRNKAVVALLIDRGADLKAKDNHGQTVLHWAAQGGNEAIVQLLIDGGADLEAKDNDGHTVLHTTALSRRASEVVVPLLIDRGADLKAKDNHGQTVLHTSVLGGSKEVVQLLIDRGADVKAKDIDGWTVLHTSVIGGNEEIVRLLIDKGADVKARDNDGQTVLHRAARQWSEAVVQLLIDRGADVKAKDNDGRTALHTLVLGGNEAVMQLLIDRGVDVKAKDNYGQTVLHTAASFSIGNDTVIQLLIDRGADVKAKDNDGQMVLHKATMTGPNRAVVRVLIDGGVDVKAKDNDGRTAR